MRLRGCMMGSGLPEDPLDNVDNDDVFGDIAGAMADVRYRWPIISAWTAGEVVSAPELVIELQVALHHFGRDEADPFKVVE